MHKSDQNFVSYPRDKQRSPLFACPGLGDSNPRRAIFISFPFTVPVKLHFDPAVFVNVNLLPFWSHDHSTLRSPDNWLRR